MEIRAFLEQGRVMITILEIIGNVDSGTAEQLRTRAQEAITAGARDLLLDLTHVSYMSSAGLRVVNILFNQLHPEALGKDYAAVQKGLSDGTFRSPHLKLCSLNANVRQVFSMAGFDMYLDIYPDRKSALASF
ncbi:Putative anti-sigma factor antagonist BtrV [Anaerolineae bacterium]|nr:Putative anti-sigma factor antagonist BtrV [Anaerolineae bacterium]